MHRQALFLRIMLVAGLIFPLSSSIVLGQLNSNTGSVTLTATLAETLTVAATPNTVNFALVAGGTATGNSPVAITTTWALSGSRTSVVLYGYFASNTAALASGAPVSNIPSSDVFGQVTTGTPTSYTAFTQTNPLGATGAGLVLFNQAIVPANVATSRTDNLSLQIQLASTAQLPAGSYAGTLTLQAQAM